MAKGGTNGTGLPERALPHHIFGAKDTHGLFTDNPLTPQNATVKKREDARELPT